MSFFGEINQDAVRGSIDDASVGPRLGFQDAFVAAWDATTKAHSMLAVEQGIRAKEQEQIKRIREAGLRPPNSLDDSEDTQPILGGDNTDRNPLATTFRQGRYSAAAQSIVDGGGWYTDEMVAQRDEHLRKLQADRPDLGIQTYGEMFKSVQNEAQEAEKRSQLPKSWGGEVGDILGKAAGSMDPSSNPLNFATMGVGGGTGVVGRAAVQGLAQGATEAVNLAAADPENLLLGHQRTPGEDVGRIGMAMAAGAGADLLFSGAHAAIRKARTGKWFVDQPLPEPPAPKIDTTPAVFQGEVPPPSKAGLPLHEYPDWESFARAHGEEPMPYGFTPEAKRRTAADLNYVSEELNRWDGPAPWEIRPPSTDTAAARVMSGPQSSVEIKIASGGYTRYLDNLETVHDIARRTDPDLFRQYDHLQQQIVELRATIEREKGVQTFFDADEAARRARELTMREQIQKYDQQMRDMAPLVSRAYGIAEKEWRSTPLDHNTIEFYKSIEESGAQWRYRGESEPSLTEKPPRQRMRDPETVWSNKDHDIPVEKIGEPAARGSDGRMYQKVRYEGKESFVPADELKTRERPVAAPPTVDDTVPLASMEPNIDKRLHVDTDTAAERVKQNVAHTIEKLDEKVDQFAKVAEKQAKLEAKDIVEQTKALEEKLTALREQRTAEPGKTPEDRAADSEQIAKVEKELDELHYVTFPDGRKLHLDNDSAPFVHEDGRVEEMSVRDFMREMAKDQDALKSVVSCSRPS